jgi:hypothetical protein
MIQIRFKASGANSVIGGFSSGDLARVSEAFAKHLVEEAHVAEYVKAGEPAKPKKVAKTKAKPAEVAADSAIGTQVENVSPVDGDAVTPAPTFESPVV